MQLALGTAKNPCTCGLIPKQKKILCLFQCSWRVSSDGVLSNNDRKYGYYIKIIMNKSWNNTSQSTRRKLLWEPKMIGYFPEPNTQTDTRTTPGR